MMTFEEAVKKSIQNRRPDLYRFLLKIGAKRIGFKKVKLKDMKIDQGIYPREETDWDRVEIYAEAMKNGDQFPPLVTAKEPKNLIVDGNHRYYGLQKSGFEEYWVEEWDIPKDKVKLAAQALNSEPGKIETPLTGKEKKKAIIEDWEDGIRDLELIAEALRTSVGYVKNVLSKAGFLKSRKEQMKERARQLREQGLSYREIAKKLEEEFGEKIAFKTIQNWLENKNKRVICHSSDNLHTPPHPTSQEPDEIIEQEEETTEEYEYARYKDTEIPLSVIEYLVGECRAYVETGTTPEEAVELVEDEVKAEVSPKVKKYVIDELYKRYWKGERAEETKENVSEEEIQKWVEQCKPYIDAGFDPKDAVAQANVPEELRNLVVKKLVGYKNHLYQEEERNYRAKLGPVKSRRRDVALKIHRIVSLIQEVETDLKNLDAVFLREEGDTPEALKYGRDQYMRNYILFAMVRGGWEKAEWFREITKQWVHYVLHPDYAKEWLPDIKEQAEKTPEQWEEECRKFYEEYIADEAQMKWLKFCESLGLPVPKEYGGKE